MKYAATGWVQVFDISREDSASRRVNTGHGRGAIAVGHGAVWVANSVSCTVARLDLRTLEVTDVLGLRKSPVAIAVGDDAVWVVCSNGWLWRIWPAGPRAEGVARLGARARAIAASGPSIWVLRERGELIRLEPATGEEEFESSIGRGARHLVAGDGALWATCSRGRKILRIDRASGTVEAEIRSPHQVVCLAAGDGTLWIGCRRPLSPRKGWLYAVDPGTLRVDTAHELPGRPRAIEAGDDAVWVASAPRNKREGEIKRFDLDAAQFDSSEQTDWPVYDLALVSGSLLATMGISVSNSFDAGAGIVFDVGGAGGGDGGGGGGGN